MNILFLCTSNINRSKTAEDYFDKLCDGNTYKSAGLSERYCKKYSSTLCNVELLDWADVVYVMEVEHCRRIKQYAGEEYLSKVVNLGIEDVYKYMEPALVELLVSKVENA